MDRETNLGPLIAASSSHMTSAEERV